jgi:septum formation protein
MNDLLGANELLLASKSPRRSDLLKSIGIPFTTISCEWDEEFDSSMDIHAVPQFLAYVKALYVKDQIKDGQIVLTADTVVIQDGRVLGKPKDKEDAERTLHHLSNNTHKVITGTTFMSKSKTVNTSCMSVVDFMEISNDEIEQYIEEFKPFDKAGSYGIQDWIGICKIKSIKGSYHNIMGLPTHIVYEVLKAWN